MRIFFSILVLIVLTVPAFSQTPKPPEPNPLALTETERAEGDKLAREFSQKSAALQQRIEAVLIGDVDAITTAALAARLYFREQLQPAQQAYTTWLLRAQKAHNCDGCELREGVFARPEGKAK